MRKKSSLGVNVASLNKTLRQYIYAAVDDACCYIYMGVIWGVVIVVAAVRRWFYILFYLCQLLCLRRCTSIHCVRRLLNRKCQSLMNWKLVLQIKYPCAYSISRWFFALLESIRLNLYCRVYPWNICWGFGSMYVLDWVGIGRYTYAHGVFYVYKCCKTVLLGFRFQICWSFLYFPKMRIRIPARICSVWAWMILVEIYNSFLNPEFKENL